LYNFKDVWNYFRRNGWKAANGPALSYDHYYIKPNKTVKGGIENEDWFLAESSLVEYAKKIKLFGEESEEEKDGEITEDTEDEHKEEEEVYTHNIIAEGKEKKVHEGGE
jgi:hypothetical protein